MELVSRESIFLMAILGLITAASSVVQTTWNVCGEYTFDVIEFGAVGDGENDDVQAFELAWEAACESETDSVAIVVPGGRDFLISQIVFQGSCKPSNIYFMILGNLVAPPKSVWLNQTADEWLQFLHVDGLTVDGDGKGVIDGRGETWWNLSTKNDNSSRPTALRFYGCNNLKVWGLRHVNSPMNHLSLNFCNKANVGYLMMKAPYNSPNTDGIDVSFSTGLRIHDIIMKTGDDCIAINGGTSNINISNIMCGPGHGISCLLPGQITLDTLIKGEIVGAN